MAKPEMTIGKLAKITNCKPETIRYYEKIGLLPVPARNLSGYRLYRESHQRQLAFIRRARDLGFSLDDIGLMLGLTEDRQSSCQEISRLSRKRLATIRNKLNQLQILSDELNRLIDQCDDGKISDCRIIEALTEDTPLPHPPSR
jgi:DNA-binding transcriptional MerR regulator